MSVGVDNSSKFSISPLDEQPVESERIEHKFTPCLNCGAEVILLARTIQTFCYQCGESVTKPDKANMYYEELLSTS
jgi:ribosomal protein S27AE